MEWVAIDVHIGGNAVTHRLAEAFKLRVAEAAGLLMLTFAGMAEHAPDGSLVDVPSSQIESWAQWHGKRGKFAEFFRAQLCDEIGIVREWEDYNGASMRAAESSRERSRRWREVRRREREVRDLEALRLAEETANGTALQPSDGTPERTAFATSTEPVANASTGQDLTGHDSPTGKEPPPAAGTIGPNELRLRAKCGDEHYPDVEAYLAQRPWDKRDEWAKEFDMLTGPTTGGLPEDLARTCRDADLAEPPVRNAGAFRKFFAVCQYERQHGRRPEAAGGQRGESRGNELLALARRYDLFTYGGNAAAYEAKLAKAAADSLAGPDFRREATAARLWEGVDAPNDMLKARELDRRLDVRKGAA